MIFAISDKFIKIKNLLEDEDSIKSLRASLEESTRESFRILNNAKRNSFEVSHSKLLD